MHGGDDLRRGAAEPAGDQSTEGTMVERAERKAAMRVMVAFDDSECSRYALSWALRYLLSPDDSRLIIFCAQPLLEFSYVFATSTYIVTPVDLISDLQENQRKATLALLEQAKEICTPHGISAETLTEVGEPKDAICEVVKKHHIQLLIMGSHGRGAIQRAFLGSVSNYCVHNANCPVLIVRKPA
ncbi:hypothetical protein SAY87_025106 [Trapa incisa]|uniref:UspA domain-containing protein n=1 Tax=Trapa incisa TaxID=236973 RepID=A0AAN7JGG2_9MYRT|nr:hypothetical protein SAY87_025106 [Trapa incisa]